MTMNQTNENRNRGHHFRTTVLYDESSEKDRLDFYADVSKGLQSTPKHIPGKYVYDDVGSGTFLRAIL